MGSRSKEHVFYHGVAAKRRKLMVDFNQVDKSKAGHSSRIT